MEPDTKTLELERRIRRLEERFGNLLGLLQVAEVPYFDGIPPRPPEPQNRIIKEGHIPPRTDGRVSWWRRALTACAQYQRSE